MSETHIEKFDRLEREVKEIQGRLKRCPEYDPTISVEQMVERVRVWNEEYSLTLAEFDSKMSELKEHVMSGVNELEEKP